MVQATTTQLSTPRDSNRAARLEADAEAREAMQAWFAGLASEPPATPEELAKYPTVAQLRRIIACSPCRCEGRQVFRVAVPPNHPAYHMTFPCSCLVRERARKLDALFPTAGVPPRFEALDFDTFAELPAKFREGKAGMLQLAQAFANVDAYARDHGIRFENPAGREDTRPGALFFGPVGCGKTAMASIVAKAWMHAGFSVLWVTYLDFMDAVQGGYSDGLYDRRVAAARNVDLLVMDDFGREREGSRPETDDKTKLFDRIVAHRNSHNLATLFTTNLEPKGIEDQFDARIAQRIIHELCHAMRVTGRSLRPLASM
jgi:DNA replication protein DnaC